MLIIGALFCLPIFTVFVRIIENQYLRFENVAALQLLRYGCIYMRKKSDQFVFLAVRYFEHAVSIWVRVTSTLNMQA
jgi:hypothetical protein